MTGHNTPRRDDWPHGAGPRADEWIRRRYLNGDPRREPPWWRVEPEDVEALIYGGMIGVALALVLLLLG